MVRNSAANRSLIHILNIRFDTVQSIDSDPILSQPIRHIDLYSRNDFFDKTAHYHVIACVITLPRSVHLLRSKGLIGG